MKKVSLILVTVLCVTWSTTESPAAGRKSLPKAGRAGQRAAPAPAASDSLLEANDPAGAVNPFEGPAVGKPRGEIDKLVLGRLRQLGIVPANLCSDAVFVRRVYLDVIGTLPTADEARAFLADRDPDKRSALIDRLLERDEFADYWSMKWSDVLRVKSEFPINLWPNAVQAYHRWIRTCLKENLPYDRFVREMLTASGSNFRVPQVNFYRAVQSREPQALAQAVALTFMGVRPESWPQEKWADMAVFFSQIRYKPTLEWKEEIVLFDPNHADHSPVSRASRPRSEGETPSTQDPPLRAGVLPDQLQTAVFPDGTTVQIPPDRDPREVFADWLIDARNPWFARNIVNRVWSWLVGRGIIHEPDDIRPDNPPSHPRLLVYLEGELVAARYDLKHLFRLILNSQIYQLSSLAGTEDRGMGIRPVSHRQDADATVEGVAPSEHGRDVGDTTAAEANFACYPLRRLEAEVLIDALCQITGTTEQYSSPIPEPFTFIPEDLRSIALADASITSPFLETFGRSARDTGLESERNNRPTAAQRLHLLNSSHVQRKIEQSAKLQALLQPRGRPRDPIDALYLTILSRYPTNEELKTIGAYFQAAGANRRGAGVDLIWALINSAEFLYRH
ncbi:MAG: DUF1553 domain-containing protein [Planctomycetes bacterium]|nr:DUF1553 domain-containing protein [Planctomycetota bacterium]